MAQRLPAEGDETPVDDVFEQLRPLTAAADAIDKAAEALHAAITAAAKSLIGSTPTAAMPGPTERDALWHALDWCLWGVGLGDTFREPLADKMVGALNSAERAQALALIADWRERRGGPNGLAAYADLRAENERLRAAPVVPQTSDPRV